MSFSYAIIFYILFFSSITWISSITISFIFQLIAQLDHLDGYWKFN